MPTSPRERVLTAVALAGALTLSLAPGAGAVDGDGSSPDGGAGTVERRAAVAVLDRAEAVLDGTAPAPDRSATMALREVMMLRGSLGPDLAARAAALLARPSDEGGTWTKTCNTEICVHHLVGADIGSGEYDVNDVLATMQHIHDTYVAAGYREPRQDGAHGGDDRIDVYLEDVGSEGLYGYCTSDDPKELSTQNGFDVWSYCALDDDFSPAQFGTRNTPLENMQVTAAHEYFHATQFAYDATEDSWIMEATATWAEDELYDAVDDNHAYIDDGPVAHPTIPLDTFQGQGLFQYGAWTFVRYLTEAFPEHQSGLPTLVRELWERMDGAVGGPNRYSLTALDEALSARQSNLATMFARYSVANRAPALGYEEGAAYPTAPAKSVTLSTKAKNPRAFVRTLDHLTSSTVRYRPGNLSASDWRLGLTFNLAPEAAGSAAVITLVRKSGARQSVFADLDARGDAKIGVPFSSRKVTTVEVTLLNLSGRLTDCWDGSTPYSCQGGDPLDDNLRQSVDPVAYRGSGTGRGAVLSS